MTDDGVTRVVDKIVAAVDLAHRCHLIVAARLADETGLSMLLARSDELAHANPVAAETLAEAASVVANDHRAFETAAGFAYLRARLAANGGAPVAALELIDEAAAGYRRAGNELAALRTGLGRMHALDDLGRHFEAAEVAEQTLGRLDSIDVNPDDADLAMWIRAATLENLGVAHGFTGAHEQALTAYLHAEGAYRQLGMDSDLARVRANRGVELVELGQAAHGLAELQDSADQFMRDGDRLWHAKCLGHQATAHMMRGDYPAALSALEQARGPLEELGARAEATRLEATVAEVSLALSLHEEGFDVAVKAAATFRDAGMLHDLARALRICGVACVRSQRPDQAIALFEEAQLLLEQVGSLGGASETSLARAEVLHSQGQVDLARSITLAATQALVNAGSSAQLALALMQLSDLSVEPERRRHLERARVLVEDLALPPLAHPLHLRLGRSYRSVGDTDTARQHLEAAVEIIDRLQGTVVDEALRAVFLGDKRQAIDELVELLLALPRPDVAAAFALCERARSRTLVELISGSIADRSSVGAEHLRLGRELNAIYNALLAIEGPGHKGRRRALLSRANELEHDLTLLRLRPTGPGTTDPGTPDVLACEPARVAPSDTSGTVITYEVLGDRIHVFLGVGSDLLHQRLEATLPEVLERLGEFSDQGAYFQLGSRFGERNAAIMVATSQAVLGDLYTLLVAPLVHLLALDGRDTPLTIVPTRDLHQVPFHALFDGVTHLVSRASITLAPSASIAARFVEHPAITDTARLTDAGSRALVMGISDATTPCATYEAKQIASMFPAAHLCIDDDATVGRLRELGPTADVIHLACHGLHRAENPLFSSLCLADGWITAAEIMRLELNGATVVLSACESGRQSSTGSEPLGLSWAFLAAGASAVVVSLWAVQDNVTAELMMSFYRHLTGGSGHARALSSAQLDTAERWPHPYHWAPFVLVGPFPRSSPWRMP